MKKPILMNYILAILLSFLSPCMLFANDIPHEIGGFVLGSDITDYPDIEYSNFLKEVVIYDWHGFDKGILSYAICENPGEIVKIKLKYSNSSKKYFKVLFKKYKEKYGKPTKWKGDSFGILHIWKWNFLDKNNNKVHLILQHNTKNPNENNGNMVKLYLPDQISREQACFSQQCTQNISEEEKKKRIERKKSDWKFLIPQ